MPQQPMYGNPMGNSYGLMNQNYGMVPNLTYFDPEQGNGNDPSQIHELNEHVRYLSEGIEKELENNKVISNNQILEQKCEEYLSQLQRSADIIENTKEKNAMQLEHMNERLEDLENSLKAEQDRVVT